MEKTLNFKESTLPPDLLTRLRRRIENRLKRNPRLVEEVARFLRLELK